MARLALGHRADRLQRRGVLRADLPRRVALARAGQGVAQVRAVQAKRAAKARRLKAEVGVALALAAQGRKVRAALEDGLHGLPHGVLHVALAAVEGVDGDVADARAAQDVPGDLQLDGIGAHGGAQLPVLQDDVVVVLGTVLGLVELGQQAVEPAVRAVHAEYVIEKIDELFVAAVSGRKAPINFHAVPPIFL